ncbi:hypothetical protein EYF80_039554 [Liparis tanakae]|uniref:Uncharacterized protein n=1 Tax=Liparis tanakae TaxID=230148 RepID=A0A4Z2G9T3_9TELE|nr:hypothetical protein EYF80_039554 [Liparis tanakae]
MLRKNTSVSSARASSRMCSVTRCEVRPGVKSSRPEAGAKSTPLSAVWPEVCAASARALIMNDFTDSAWEV